MKPWGWVNERFPCPICGSRLPGQCRFTKRVVICYLIPSESGKRAKDGWGWIHEIKSTRWPQRAAKELRRQAREAALRQMERVDREGKKAPDTSQELLQQVAWLFRGYGRHSYETRQKHRKVWDELAIFVGQRYGLKLLQDLQPEHVAKFLEAKGYSASWRRTVLAAIDRLYRMIPGVLSHYSMRKAVEAGDYEAGYERQTRLMPQAEAAIRRVRDFAYTTRERYATVFRRFVRWLEANTEVPRLQEVTEEHVRGYIEWRRGQGVREVVIRQELAAIEGVMKVIEGRRLGGPLAALLDGKAYSRDEVIDAWIRVAKRVTEAGEDRGVTASELARELGCRPVVAERLAREYGLPLEPSAGQAAG